MIVDVMPGCHLEGVRTVNCARICRNPEARTLGNPSSRGKTPPGRASAAAKERRTLPGGLRQTDALHDDAFGQGAKQFGWQRGEHHEHATIIA